MLLAESIYNFVLLGINIVVCLYLLRRMSILGFATVLFLSLAASLAVGVLIGLHPFRMLRLTCWGWLLQAPLLCLAMAVIAWKKQTPRVALVGTIVGLVGIAIAVDSAILEPRWLDVTEYVVVSDRVTEELTIAVVADLQTDKIGAYEESVFARIRRRAPDMVLFAGDYLQLHNKARPAQAAKLRSLTEDLASAVPLGLFAVGGNSDAGWRDLFPAKNCELFARTRTAANTMVDVTGLSVPDSFNTELSIQRTSDQFHIVLGHSPDFALGDVDADLLVAGHTHGGQVRLPFLGPLLTMSHVPRRWASGLTELAIGKTLIVSRGIGMERLDAPRVRFLCRPQLVYVRITPGK